MNLNFILDLLFPRFCVGCQKEGIYLCSQCRKEIVLNKFPKCPTCQTKTKRGEFCPKDGAKFALKGVFIASHFQKGPLREAIHHFKYNHIRELDKDLGEILFQATNPFWPKGDLILVPVPLYPKRHRQRGFNQAELLCRQLMIQNTTLVIPSDSPRRGVEESLSKVKGSLRSSATAESVGMTLKIIQGLKRIKNTNSQVVSQKRKERLKNLEGAFKWTDGDELKGKTVLLVDDVTTTFSTLNEAAKVLKKQAGVKEVWGVVLAKG